LLDQDVYKVTVQFLRGLNHDVVLASELGMAQAADEELLRAAQQEERIFVTRDRDYGSLVFIRRILTGVLYLRMTPLTQTTVHQELARVLMSYSEERLKHSYVVIEANGHRIRDLTK
jgi:predicted nuclease of predicted toxin-antitoxin system